MLYASPLAGSTPAMTLMLESKVVPTKAVWITSDARAKATETDTAPTQQGNSSMGTAVSQRIERTRRKEDGIVFFIPPLHTPHRTDCCVKVESTTVRTTAPFTFTWSDTPPGSRDTIHSVEDALLFNQCESVIESVTGRVEILRRQLRKKVGETGR